MSNKIYLMGIDIGSTTIKAVIYDKFGNIISVGRVKTGNPEIVKDSGSSAGYQSSIYFCVLNTYKNIN